MRQKKISREEYVKAYCSERRIRDRKVLYVSEETHQKIRYIAHLFRNEYATVASLVDAILTQHIEQYKDLFAQLAREDQEELRYKGQSASQDQEEDEQDEASEGEGESGIKRQF